MFRVVLILVLASQTYLSAETSYRYIPESTLKVTSVKLEPYLMENPAYMYNDGIPMYIGYIPDLIKEISKILNVDYVISPSRDNSFGYKTGDGSWDGMIGEIMRQEADIAAGPMYETSQRARAVDFSAPFINVEATLLLRKPLPGSTLNIRSVDDLLNQSEIKYGTLDRGIIIRAFKNTNSTALKMMWRKMNRFDPPVFTKTNEDGIARVRNEKYGFVLPHTIGEYMSMQDPCDLVTIDRFLMRRGYSLAVGKGSNLLGKVNRALRILSDNGKLNELYRLWWIGRSKCNGSKSSKMHSSPHLASAGRAAPSGESSVFISCLCALFVILCSHVIIMKTS